MSIDRSTEVRRLAKLLHRDVGELSYLDALNGSELQELRQAFQNRLLNDHGETFAKLAAGGKIAPDALSAMLCKRIFGPTITANMAYYTPAEKAARMIGHFDDEFMAEVVREQIPERAQELLEKIPADLMRGATRALLASRDFHIMGGMTDYMPEEKIAVLMEEITDIADNLRTSSYCQHKDRIARLTIGFDDELLKELIEAAFQSEEFIIEVGLVTAEMDAASQQRMARLTDEIDPAYRRKAREIAEQQGTTEALAAYFQA